MAGIAFRLQDLYTVSVAVSEHQDKQDAVDVVQYASLVFQARRPVQSAMNGSVIVQHASVLDDSAFVDTSVSFETNSSLTPVQTLEGPLRYIRWRYDGTSATGQDPQFLIDVVARESS